ncbi:response regulator [Flavobacterium sp.]|uniref:response regulator n=1 Tax=Flavobacterium sp. TaxID=239 RepID=UPI0026395CDC|nr:response regulator [Flavobacterium sp.]
MEKYVTVIDDDPIALMVAGLVLKKIPNIKVQTFTDGIEALQVLRTSDELAKADNFIFLDLNMPLYDGWEIVQQIGADEKLQSVKIVLLSSSVDPEDQQRAKLFPQVISFLAKPLSKEAVINLMQ